MYVKTISEVRETLRADQQWLKGYLIQQEQDALDAAIAALRDPNVVTTMVPAGTEEIYRLERKLQGLLNDLRYLQKKLKSIDKRLDDLSSSAKSDASLPYARRDTKLHQALLGIYHDLKWSIKQLNIFV